MTDLERIGWELETEAKLLELHGGERRRPGTPRKTILNVILARVTALRDRLLGEIGKL